MNHIAMQPTATMQELFSEREKLQSYLSSVKQAQKTQAKGNLKVLTKKNCFQYYIIKDVGDSNGTYLPKKDIRKAVAIAQRDYNRAAAAELKEQIATIDRFLAKYRPGAIDAAYTELHPGRRALVTPVRESDDEFVAAWQHHPYTGKPFEINAPEFYTSTGVRVRSKSEVIIADALCRAGIPFRYEYSIGIKGWGTLYPDFTCLNKRTREEIIWEHFGLMGDPDYVENAVQKIAHYAANSYVLGKNFIATFENGNTPLSVKQVQAYIKALLM
ncbi:MAG: hypothetical protein IK114_11545 [Fibrobacter sp.]|nr:hypothetical protein [Fibrobacter sp.]